MKINIPDKYVEDVKAYIESKEKRDMYEQMVMVVRNSYAYARQQMFRDPGYQEELKKLEKPYLEHYRREYYQRIRQNEET